MPETKALLEMIQSGIVQRKESLPAERQETPRKIIQPPLPLVGRESELKQMHTAWQQAQMGSGRFMLLSGDSGIGKTRLLDEFLLSIPAQSVLQSFCHQIESMVSYAPLRGSYMRFFRAFPKRRCST